MFAASPDPVTVQVSVMSQDAKKLELVARPFGAAMGTRQTNAHRDCYLDLHDFLRLGLNVDFFLR